MPTTPTAPTLVDRLRAAGCVSAEPEAALLEVEASDVEALERVVALRVSGMPLEQVVGWAEFYGHRIVVTPGVFVPRQRTALLVATGRSQLEAATAAMTAASLAPDVVEDQVGGTVVVGRFQPLTA